MPQLLGSGGRCRRESCVVCEAPGAAPCLPVTMLDRERGWSVSFAGCGFLGVYHIGAASCLQERAPHIIRDARHVYGASAGALAGAVLVGGGNLGQRLRASAGAAGCLAGEGERVGEGRAGEGAGVAGRAGCGGGGGGGRLRASGEPPPGTAAGRGWRFSPFSFSAPKEEHDPFSEVKPEQVLWLFFFVVPLRSIPSKIH